MKQPLVTVVIPVYNVEKYLEECFKSVVNQSYDNLEIILVNDGSTDASGEIADRLAETDSRAFVVHKENGGLSDARNTAIRIAKGEYITFVDSDDSIHVDFIGDLIQLANKHNADIAQCSNSRKLEELGNGKGEAGVLPGNLAFVQLIKYRIISPTAWGKIYKTSLFLDNNIEFPVGRIHEDTAVLYKLIYCAKNVTFIDKVLYYYRLNNNSIMTSSYTEAHYNSVIQYGDELMQFIEVNKIHISNRIINKHMALRFVSVLNRLALAKGYHSPAYKNIKHKFMALTKKSHSITCWLCTVPAQVPTVFILMSSFSPVMRKILGKT